MTLLVFAFGAGMLSTVNPCGFAMLPALLGYYLGEQDQAQGGPGRLLERLAQGFGVGLAVSSGFAAVFTVAGLLVSLGLRSLVQAVPWAAVIIGAMLVVVGLMLVAGRHVGVRMSRDLNPGTGRGYRRMVVFGAAYAVASLSCTLAILLAVVAQATATANPLQLVGVFAAYGLGAASILVSLSVAAALAKATVARAVRRLLPVVGRLGGGVLALSGLYLIAYWLPSLTGSRSRPATGMVEAASSRLTTILDAHQGTAAALLVILTIVGVAVLWGLRRRTAAVHEAMVDDADCCAQPDPVGVTEEVTLRAGKSR